MQGQIYPRKPENTRISEVQGLNRVRFTYFIDGEYSNHIRNSVVGQGPDEY